MFKHFVIPPNIFKSTAVVSHIYVSGVIDVYDVLYND